MTEEASSSCMASSMISTHQSLGTSDDENKECITLIWFDPNIRSREDTKITMDRLRAINDYVAFHNELEPCLAYLRSIQNEKIFLITSGSRASELLPQIDTLHQIDTIFIFCMKKCRYEHLTVQYPKIVDIYVDLDSLCRSIQEQVVLVHKQLETFSFFDQHQNSIRELSKQSAEFIWFQLFTHVISRLPRSKQAKQQMLDICRHYYRGNRKEQVLINNFEHDYRPDEAIPWYSKESFVYRLVKKALLTEDIVQLHMFRFFIGDLSENLSRAHHNFILSGEKPLILYRGTNVSIEEFDIETLFFIIKR